MASDYPLISQQEITVARDFLNDQARKLIKEPSGRLYHYTTGQNFINILQSGELWSTQIGCLNDAKEVLFTVDCLQDQIVSELTTVSETPYRALLLEFLNVLQNPGVEIAPVFVSCFSAIKDDLGQWRSYSGGEGGFAIEFEADRLALPPETQIFLTKVEYDKSVPQTIAKSSHEAAKKLLDQRISANAISDEWMKQFAEYWISQLVAMSPFIKHPAFAAEKESRLILYALGKEREIKFRQKSFLISRHIALDALQPLPITGITVGPCRHPELSRIAARDLLKAAGYDLDVVEVKVSEVPFRSA